MGVQESCLDGVGDLKMDGCHHDSVDSFAESFTECINTYQRKLGGPQKLAFKHFYCLQFFKRYVKSELLQWQEN